MVMTSSEQHSVLFQPNLEKSDNLKRLKGHMVNGWKRNNPKVERAQSHQLSRRSGADRVSSGRLGASNSGLQQNNRRHFQS